MIPTLAAAERADRLERAIRSATGQTYADLEIVVVVNGGRYDPRLVEGLRSEPRLRVVTRTEASLPKAILAGRQEAGGEAICYLDDDDVLLPDSVELRVRALQANPAAVAAFTDGELRHLDGTRTPAVKRSLLDVTDLTTSILRANWNASCATLYRTSVFGEDFFADAVPYREWTWFGLRAALRGPIEFLPVPGYRVQESRRSLSQSSPYSAASLEVLHRMQSLPLPAKTRGVLRRCLASAMHGAACDCASHGARGRALKLWLQAIGQTPWAVRYIPAWRLLFRGQPHETPGADATP